MSHPELHEMAEAVQRLLNADDELRMQRDRDSERGNMQAWMMDYLPDRIDKCIRDLRAIAEGTGFTSKSLAGNG